MSYYISILSIQYPFDIGKDSQDRQMVSCNYQVRAVHPVTKFEREMVKLLTVAGLGTYSDTNDAGTSIRIGSSASIPDGDGPIIWLINTGGRSPDEAHGTLSSPGTKYLNLTFQVIVRASDPEAARAKANAIHDLFDGKRSFEVVI